MKEFILIPNDEKFIQESVASKQLLLDELVKIAAEYRKMDLPETAPEASTTYMGIAIFNLALLYLITKKSVYLDEAKRWMKTVCQHEVWGYAYLVNVDLSASWILFGLSLGYHYLHPYLSAAEKEEIRRKLILQGGILYDHRVRTYGKGWSTQYFQNHNWINMTGLATVGYVLREEYPLAQSWVEAAKENFRHVFDDLADDGSDYEGVPYWHYGVLWLLVYADISRQFEGLDYFASSEFLKNTMNFRLSQSLSDLKQSLNYGDAHDYRSGNSIAIYYCLASRYNDGQAQFFGNYVLKNFYDEEQMQSHIKPGIKPEIGLALIWYNPEVIETPIGRDYDYSFFPDLGLMNIKNKSKMFSIKCSKPGGNKQFERARRYLDSGIDVLGLSHHHPDNSHFIFACEEDFYAIDDGYNRNCAMKHHNLVTAGDYGAEVEMVSDVYGASIREKLNQGSLSYENYGGRVIFARDLDGIAVYQCDNSGTFHDDAKILASTRTIITPRLDYVLIFDQLLSLQQHHFRWHFHSDVVPVVSHEYISIKKKHDLRLYRILPSKHTIYQEVQPIKALFTPQEPNDYHTVAMIDSVTESLPKESELFLNVLSFDDLHIISTPGMLEVKFGNRIDRITYELNARENEQFIIDLTEDIGGEAERHLRLVQLGFGNNAHTEVEVVDNEAI
ncbi:MAG: DUF4962 domain-containing protein [Bacilli bacterium]|nr:DUF4962 domain-containing protein [Bacilli bacterium]MBN2696189.1 DUF4962 domain-containing protein [Bacilli bacterium]